MRSFFGNGDNAVVAALVGLGIIVFGGMHLLQELAPTTNEKVDPKSPPPSPKNAPESAKAPSVVTTQPQSPTSANPNNVFNVGVPKSTSHEWDGCDSDDPTTTETARTVMVFTNHNSTTLVTR